MTSLNHVYSKQVLIYKKKGTGREFPLNYNISHIIEIGWIGVTRVGTAQLALVMWK